MIKKTTFIFLFVTFPFFAQEIGSNTGFFQETRTQHISQPTGLSSAKVTSILKDNKGYVWLATDNGLNRSDGRTITVFKNNKNDSGTIGNDNIKSIFQDQYNQLWVGTTKGLYIFDYQLETFIPQKIEGKVDYPIYNICEDKEGTIWFTSNLKLINYNFNKKEFKLIPFLEEISSKDFEQSAISGLKVDKQGELWIGTWRHGIYRMNTITKEYRKFKTQTNEPLDIIEKGGITCIEEGPDGSLWFGGWDYGLLRLFPGRKDVKFYEHSASRNSLNGNKVKALKFDNSGILWVGIEEVGLDKFTLDNEKFTHFFNSRQFTDISEGPGVSTIMIDDQSLMWLGFRNHGIEIVPLNGTYFQHYRNNSDVNYNYTVNSLCETDKGILIGIRGGIDYFDLEEKSFTASYNLPRQETPIALMDYGDNTAIVGTYSGSLYKVNLKNREFTKLGTPDLQRELIKTKTKAMHLLPNKDVIIGTMKGVYRIDMQTGQHEQLLQNDVHTIQSGNNGSIWFFSHNGEAYQYYPQTKKLMSFQLNVKGVLKSAYIVNDENVYMGTDLGFYSANLESRKVLKYDNIFPYINNQVNKITKDFNNKYWFSSERGIVQFDPNNQKFRTFTKEDGVPKIRFNDGVGIRLKSGAIAFGGDDGLVMFDSEKIEDRHNNASLVFTKMEVIGNESKNGDKPDSELVNISERSEVTLNYWQNNVTFTFALLSYTNPSKHQYKYQLEGFNSGWFDLGNQNSVSFTNLKSGNYVLKIKSANEDNNWGPVSELKIHVTTAWYYTWFAYLTYLLLLIGAMIYIVQFFRNREKLKSNIKEERLKLNQLKEKAKTEQEFSRLRLNFFTNISHELRTPLTLILGPLDSFVKKQKKPTDDHLSLMHKNADRLKRLITQLLDFRTMESENLTYQPSWGNITKFSTDTASLFFPMSYQKGLTFVINKNTDDLFAKFDKDKLEKIIYNLLSNAFKFTEKGSISVNINILDKSKLPKNNKWENKHYDCYFELTITDSGTGIPTDKLKQIFNRFYHLNTSDTSSREGTGIGLALTKALIDIHDGEIHTASTVDEGSIFRVLLPIQTQIPKIGVTLKETSCKTPTENEENVSLHLQECDSDPTTEALDELETILLVEDNPDLREYIRLEIGEQYTLLEAENGEEGLEIAFNTIPDLIISDISMPKMDGFEFCSAIKQNTTTSHIPIIVLTVHNSHLSKLRGFAIGVDDYIEKPFSSDLLALRIENLMKIRRKLQEKFGKEVRLDPKALPISSMDEVFLNKAMAAVELNLGNPDFSANSFADEMCMSRVHLYRKLKALTNQSVSDFVKTIRLKLAANLIGESKLTIKEAAYAVGFNNPKYFSKCFKQQFGVNPSDYEIKEVEKGKSKEDSL